MKYICKVCEKRFEYFGSSLDAKCPDCGSGLLLIEDVVNSPSHYTTGTIEVINYLEDKLGKEGFEGFCIGNVLKYVSRYKGKNGIEDLKKARWYLNRIIGEEEK